MESCGHMWTGFSGSQLMGFQAVKGVVQNREKWLN
jgi:hypothetical protein